MGTDWSFTGLANTRLPVIQLLAPVQINTHPHLKGQWEPFKAGTNALCQHLFCLFFVPTKIKGLGSVLDHHQKTLLGGCFLPVK